MDYLTNKGIVEAFRKCGIQSGSVLMLHSDAIFLAQTRPMPKKDRYALFFEALDEVIGSQGTLIIPTFTYSATKREPFIVEETPSTVGDLTEYFRKLPGVLRSRDPIFSVAVYGAKAEEFANVEVVDAFGPGSVFELLDRYNAWIACLACSIDRITYTHYVEQIFCVDYRYYKNFPFTIIHNGSSQTGTIKYFVRDLDQKSDINLCMFSDELNKQEKLQKQPIGRFSIITVRCPFFRETALSMLSANPVVLIAEGQDEV